MARAAGRARARARARPRFWPRTSPTGAARASARWTTTASRSCTWCLATTARRRRSCRDGRRRRRAVLLLLVAGLSAIAFAHDGSVRGARAQGDESKPRRGGRRARGARRNPPTRLTRRRFGKEAPRPESVSFSPCGAYVSYVRRVIRKGMRAPKLTGKPFEDEGDDADGDGIDDWFNQVCVVKFEYRLRQPFRSIKTFVSGIVTGAAAVAAAAAARHAERLGRRAPPRARAPARAGGAPEPAAPGAARGVADVRQGRRGEQDQPQGGAEGVAQGRLGQLRR